MRCVFCVYLNFSPKNATPIFILFVLPNEIRENPHRGEISKKYAENGKRIVLNTIKGDDVPQE